MLSLTAAQLISDADVLVKIGGAFGITLSGTATVTQVLDANPTLVGKLTAGFAVSGIAANIAGNLDALEADAGNIASITLTGGGTPPSA